MVEDKLDYRKCLAEFILVFLLMFVIMAVATDKRAAQNISGLAIGAVVTFDCLAAGKR